MSNLASMHKEIHDAQKFSEGYSIKIAVEENESAEKCKNFVEELIRFRVDK